MTWIESVVRRLQRPMQRATPSPQAERLLPTMRQSWRADVPGSAVVFLVALPLCLGIALASNAPMFSGLIAGVVGGLVVGALSGSQLMVSGPAAGLTAIVVTAIAALGSFEAFLASVVIGGALQIVLGLARAGQIGRYFPSAVVRGMLAAIGLILVLKQLPHAVGYDHDFEGDESFVQRDGDTTFTALEHALHATHGGAIVTSLIALAVLILWDRTGLRKLRLLPGPLAAVLVGVGVNALLGLANADWALSGEHLVTLPVIARLSDLAAHFSLPDWSAFARDETWQFGVTIGIVASLETLLSLEATDRLDPHRRESPSSRELVAQGVGNVASGLVGGLPVTGVIVRSAANIDAGSQTKLSALLHGLWLALAVVFASTLLNHIPLAALAAILLYTGYKLAHPKVVRAVWAQGPPQFVPFLVTVIAILLTDLLHGIGIGLATGFAFILFDQLRDPCFTVVSHSGAVLRRVQLHDRVSFLNKGTITRLLEEQKAGSRLELDASHCLYIDHDVLEYIGNFRQIALQRGIDLRLVGFKFPDEPAT